MLPWILISVLILLIVFGILAFLATRKTKLPTDYYALFIMGIIWLPFGIIFNNFTFTALGLVFILAGLMHKKDWKKNREALKHLNKEQQKMRMYVLIALGIVFLIGVIVFGLINYGVL